MNTSLALILLFALILSYVFRKMRLTAFTGMMLLGVVMGPSLLAVIDPTLMGISAELRQIALVIILLRAGLMLNLQELKKVGRPALLMSFVPALCEIGAVIVLAPHMLDVTILEAAVMGSVLAAVSPAVIVPKMIELTEKKRGTNAGIPQMIMAAGSVDDVFVIVLFSAAVGLVSGEAISALTLLNIPAAIVTGILAGLVAGGALSYYFRRFHLRDTLKVLVVTSVSLLILAAENILKGILPLSGLLAVMTIGATIFATHAPLASRLSAKYTKLWIAAEILLFVLIGAQLDISLMLSGIGQFIPFIFLALLARMGGVSLCLLGTALTRRERLFCMISYMPKATVQAAIGAIPLSMGLDCGNIVLTLAVLSILITAPLGAFLIDITQKYLLRDE